MARLLWLLILGAACSVAQTVEGSVFDAATGTGAGGVKVELLKGNDYLRIWINRGGTHYFIHLPVTA